VGVPIQVGILFQKIFIGDTFGIRRIRELGKINEVEYLQDFSADDADDVLAVLPTDLPPILHTALANEMLRALGKRALFMDNVRLGTSCRRIVGDNVRLGTSYRRIVGDNVRLGTSCRRIVGDNVRLGTSCRRIVGDNVLQANGARDGIHGMWIEDKLVFFFEIEKIR
jgi:acetyltransferase-like isoleucine patch superfamily enzyme